MTISPCPRWPRPLGRQPGNDRDLNRAHDFAGPHSKDIKTQDAIALGINQRFHKTARLGKGACSQDRRHRNLRQPIGDTLSFRLRFAQADSGEFRIGKKTKGHLPSRGDARLAHEVIPDDPKIVERDIGEMRAARAITHGKHIWRGRFESFINFNLAMLG